MGFNLNSALRKAGVSPHELQEHGSLSFSASCPLCQTNGALTVKGFEHISCAKCEFIGSAVELLAVRNREPVASVISHLMLDGTIVGEDPNTLTTNYMLNRRLVELLRRTQQYMRSNTPPSVRAILQELNLGFNDHLLAAMAHHITVLRADDFDDLELSKHARQTLRGLGKWNVLGIPCWEGGRLVGFWLVHPTVLEPSGFAYLELVPEAQAAIGFGDLLTMTVQRCYVVNDPVVALRHIVIQLVGRDPLVPFVVPRPSGQDYRRYIDTPTVTYWPSTTVGPDYLHWYRRALNLIGSETIRSWQVGYIPSRDWPVPTPMASSVLRYLDALAQPAHQALGGLLLTLPAAEASRQAAVLNLSLPDVAQLLSHFAGVDREFLDRILSTERDRQARQIQLDGDVIVESQAGWQVNDRTISEAILRITELRSDQQSGDGVITGTISVNGIVFPFREDLATVRRNTADWLDRQVRRHGQWARINARWSGRLLDIARAFSADRMTIVTADQTAGWGNDRTLRFPRFLVDQQGPRRVINRLTGLDLPFPAPLTDAEWGCFATRDFCVTYLALLGNLVRTAYGLPPYGLAVAGQLQVVDRIAAAFGLTIAREVTVDAVRAAETAPLPLVLTVPDEQLVNVIRLPTAKHVLCSVDRKTFDLLATYSGWLRLPTDNLGACDALRSVFYTLPRVIATAPKDDGSFFRQLCKTLTASAGPFPSNNRLEAAASQLDHLAVIDDLNGGMSVLRLLCQLAQDGQLPTTATTDGVLIDVNDLTRALQTPVLPPADIKRMTRQLFDGGMLRSMKAGRHIVVEESHWALMASWLLS